MSDLTGFSAFFEIDANGTSFTGKNANLINAFGGASDVLRLDTEQGQLKAYNECPPIKAIIGNRAKAFNDAEITIVNTQTGEVSTRSEDIALMDKLKRPNPLQTFSQFFAQQNSYIDLHGWCIQLKTYPIGYKNKITNIWNIPPILIDDIKFTGQWIDQTEFRNIIESFKLTVTGKTITLDPDSAALIVDDSIGTDLDYNFLIPDSRLKGQDLPVSTVRAAYKALNTLITKKGMIGILSNQAKDVAGHVPMQEGQKQLLQDEFKRYGITGQEWQVLISEANLNWQSMSFPVKDLMLYEAIVNGTMALCDVFGYPFRLMASEKSASYNDVNEFEKKLYRGSIIPESKSRWEQRTNTLIGYDKGFAFKSSFEHLEVLQEDKQKASAARKALSEALKTEFLYNAITLNEWRTQIKLPLIPKFGDNYYHELLTLGWTFGTTTVVQNNSENNNENVN